MGPATKTPHPTLIYNGGQQKHVTHPTLIYNGGQQKHVTHPTFVRRP